MSKYGTPTSRVSTSTAETVVEHLDPAAAAQTANQAGHVAGNAASTARTATQQVMHAAAGHGVPPAGAANSAAVKKGINTMEDLMTAGKKMAGEVSKGIKSSKSARIAGLAVLASAAGWAAERAKNHKGSAEAEYSKQEQIRRQLMSDG